MAVTISGNFGAGHTYFAHSPVVVTINGLEWPREGPFNIVKLDVIYNNAVAGHFMADTGGQPSFSFDISSALRVIWSDYTYQDQLAAATNVINGSTRVSAWHQPREYSLNVYTEYVDSSDNEITVTSAGTFTGGQCLPGRLTEMERSMARFADVSTLERTNLRYGDASTKPTGIPERVGRHSMTSWCDFSSNGACTYFHGYSMPVENDKPTVHAPLVIRDEEDYTDFLFINRRGTMETCSGRMLEEMEIEVDTKQYGRSERPTFAPSRTLLALANGGRRSWNMSSGYQTREWTEWWTTEFLMARQWWMVYDGTIIPVTVVPGKKSTSIYNRAKQQMASVDFTVTLGLDG